MTPPHSRWLLVCSLSGGLLACLVSTDPPPMGDPAGTGSLDAGGAGPTPNLLADGCIARVFQRDQDDDGLGDPALSVSACEAPDGYVDNQDDTQPTCGTNDDEACNPGDRRCEPGSASGRETCGRDATGCLRWLGGALTCSHVLPRCNEDDPLAACTGCSTHEDCNAFSDTPLCDTASGSCVQCDGDHAELCVKDGDPYVCDLARGLCAFERRVHSRTHCNVCIDEGDSACRAHDDCVNDDECLEGQACVHVPAGGGKRVCLGLPAGMRKLCNEHPPFIGLMENLKSANGAQVSVCTLATDTTCTAHRDYRSHRCGMPDPDDADIDLMDSGDRALCGVPGRPDGFCLEDDTGQFLCTVPCRNNDRDCPLGSTCEDQPTGPDLCSL